MKEKRNAWKACNRHKRFPSSNLGHSATVPCGDGVFGELIVGGRMLHDGAECGRKFVKSSQNEPEVRLKFVKKTQSRDRMKGINVSLYCRESYGKDGTTPLLLSVCVNKRTAYIPVGVRVSEGQWDKSRKRVVNHSRASTINSFLLSLLGRAEDAVMELQRNGGVRGWDVHKVKEAIADMLFPKETDLSVLGVMRQFMNDKEKPNTKDKYQQTITHLERWLGRGASQLQFADVTPLWLDEFDRYLLKYCPSQSSRSIHMRNLRAVFNFALTNDLTNAKYPFKKYKIKTAVTQPRTLTLEQLRLLWNHKPADKYKAYWLDMWKLIFCLIGINMADLWLLDKVSQGRISYYRQKTGRLYSIKVEPEAKALIEAHKGRKALVNLSDRIVSTKRATAAINRNMQAIAKDLELPPITAYTARYTWATLAQSIDIPIEVISQALGHTYGMAVTLGYIMPDRRKVDEANRKVLDLVKK